MISLSFLEKLRRNAMGEFDGSNNVLDYLLEGCQILSKDYRYLYVNETVAKQGKKTVSELLGRSMTDVYPGIDRTEVFSKIRMCNEREERFEIENEFVYEDGSSAWFLLKIEPVPEGVFILSIDISARKKIESELRNQIERIEALREIDLAIVETSEANKAIVTILEKVTETLDVDAAAILFLDRSAGELVFSQGLGFRTPGIRSSRVKLGEGHAGRAASYQRRLFIADLRSNPRHFLRADLIKGEEFVSYAVVPLSAHGTLLGVLEVYHRSALNPEEGWFSFFEALAGQASIAIDNGMLLTDLKRANSDLLSAYDTTIEGWSKALDLRDRETEGHTLRVTAKTLELATFAGISGEELVHIRRGALLHDIGKMGIPDAILLKTSPLTEEEWTIMRNHPVYAKNLLEPIEYLRPCLTIPYSHHEHFDGSGYPQGLKGERIPFAARLFSVVDVWDALSFDRPYRKAWEASRVLEYLRDRSGTQFDPFAVDAFLRCV